MAKEIIRHTGETHGGNQNLSKLPVLLSFLYTGKTFFIIIIIKIPLQKLK